MSPDRAPRAPRRKRSLISRFFRVVGLLLLLAIVGGIAYVLYPRPVPQSEAIAAVEALERIVHLRPVSEFETISDLRARSVAYFEEAGRVIQSPRCMNCHPRSDSPTQTDAMRAHTPWVSRGADGRGETAMRCTTCHGDENAEVAGVPGSPAWHLAPIEMAWQGMTLGEICQQLLDPERSHMNREQLLAHMAGDALVGWAWNPGGNRTPAPGTQEEFGALIKGWLDTGGECPK